MVMSFSVFVLKYCIIMSKSRYFRIRLYIDVGSINPQCVYDNIHVYTRLYSAKRAARSMAIANYPPAAWFVDEVDSFTD